ncbi:MAG: type II toxin-antitoxin system HigB family toxin [Opitutaceae bacterium]|nr:type II toxin-antitoxin system HigB family toxin [Opitutaceae bacterium]
MRLITQKRIKEWQKEFANEKARLAAWVVKIEAGEWTNLVELRQVFPTADAVTVKSGRSALVFDIGGRRLICIHFWKSHTLYVKFFLSHDEYMQGSWKLNL